MITDAHEPPMRMRTSGYTRVWNMLEAEVPGMANWRDVTRHPR